MTTLSTGALALLVAVNYGWRPADPADPSIDAPYEYLVQVGPDDVEALQEGRAAELSSVIPPGVGPIDRIRIRVGEGEVPRVLTRVDQQSPKRLAAQYDAPTEQRVAKPVSPEWAPPRESTGATIAPQSRTAYQNPQNLDAALQQGFQQAFSQPVASAPGNTDPLQPLTDAARNLSQATGQSLEDLTRGAQDVFGGVVNGVRQSTEGVVDSVGNIAANTVNVGDPQYFNARNAPPPPPVTPAQYGSPTGPQSYYPGVGQGAGSPAANSASPGFTSPPVTAAPPYQPVQQSFSSAAQETAPQQSGYYTDEFKRPFYYNATTGTRQPVRYDAATQTYVFIDAQADSIANRYSSDAPPLTPVGRPNESQFSVAEQTTAQRPNTSSPWGEWPAPTTPTTSSAQPPLGGYAQNNTPPFGSGVGTANPGSLLPAPPPPSSSAAAQPIGAGVSSSQGWGDNKTRASDPANNARTGSTGETVLLMFVALGSLFFSLFVGSSYLDMRNKYRAALRRGPSVYQQAA